MKDSNILSLEKQAMERLRNSDPGGYLKLGAEEILYIDPALIKPIGSLKDLKKHIIEIQGQVHSQRAEFIDARVDSVGNAAVLTYNYRTTVLSAAETMIKQTLWNVSQVYYFRDARWQVVHSHWSYTLGKPPQTLEIPLPVQINPSSYTGLLNELMEIESGAMERWRKGDPWGFYDLYTADFTYFDPGAQHRLTGLRTMKTEMEKWEGQINFDAMDFIEPQVRLFGDLAVLNYRFFSTRLDNRGAVISRTPWNCTEVYVRRGNQWRILHSHWSYIKGVKA